MLSISPGRGLGPVLFGMRPNEVEKILGEAPVSEFERDSGDSYRTLGYPDKEVLFYFHEKNDWRLSSIEIGGSLLYALFGEAIFSKQREEIIELLRENLGQESLSQVEEEYVEGLSQTMLWVPSIRGWFYFGEGGALEEFQWSAFYGSDDEIAWPSLET